MFRVGFVTVLATTLNVVGADEEVEDKAPESFLSYSARFFVGV